MDTKDLERLLQDKVDNDNNIVPLNYVPKNTNQAPQKANKCASLQDFIEMVAMLVSKTMKKRNVIFKPDEGARKPKLELKPREREAIVEASNDKSSNRQGRIWGQKFSVIVQFNFLACDYSTVNAVMNDFESLIFSYTPYFKRNGVAEILFQKHFTDKNLDIFRQLLSARSLQYYLEIEKLTAVFESEIEEITII